MKKRMAVYIGNAIALMFVLLVMTSRNIYATSTVSDHTEIDAEAENTISGNDTVGEKYSGTWDNITWELDENGKLTLSGTGEMKEFEYSQYFTDAWKPYHNKIKSVVIQNGITNISSRAFELCYNLESVSIPDSVTAIGESAFWSCETLTEVSLPDSLERIEWEAFRECTGLKEIVFPAGLKYIGMYAFEDCIGLECITFLGNATEIDYGAFRMMEFSETDCNLKDVYYAGTVNEFFVEKEHFNRIYLADNYYFTDGNVFTSVNYKYALVDDNKVKIIKYAGNETNLQIPDVIDGKKVVCLGESSFRDCSLVSVSVPASVKTIEKNAFYHCVDLVEINLTEGVTSIGDTAFCWDSEITIFTLPRSLVNIGDFTFGEIDWVSDVYYNGTKAEWNKIQWGIGRFYNYPTIHCLDGDIPNWSGAPEEDEDKKDEQENNNENEIPDGPDTWKDKTGVEGFVSRLYNVAMTREAEEAGFADWNNRLETKQETAAEVAYGFVFSDEFKNKQYNDVQYIKILYRTMFGRDADEAGLNDWLSALENGMSREYVYRGFAQSQEFTNLCDSYSVERGSVELSKYRDQNRGATGFIARLYTKMLGRGFDEAGIEDWCGRYLRGEYTIENIATEGFLHSEELINQNLSNEEFVKRMYETFLDREPEEAGLKDWVQRLESGEVTRDTLVYGFTNSKEFANIKAEYGL